MQLHSSDRTKGIVALVLLSLSFALFGYYSRELATEFTNLQQVYARFFVALLIALLLYGRTLTVDKVLAVSKHDWGILIIRALSSILLGVTLYTEAVQLTTLGVVILLGAIPFTALWGVLLFKERLSAQKIFLLLLGFTGVALVAIKSDLNALKFGRGEVLAIFSSLFFSFGVVLRKAHSPDLSNTETSLYFMAVASLVVFLASILCGEGLPNTITAHAWLVLIISAVFIAINVLAIQYGFQKVDAITAGAVLNMEIVFAILLGYLAYGEVLSLREMFGGILIVVSTVMFGFVDRKQA